MLGGFTFKGIHSSTYGVRETPTSSVLSPLKRRSLIEIPGRSSSFIQEDGGYEVSKIGILCSYAPTNLYAGSSVIAQIRKIAGWLDGVGELTFDYEPGMHYNAFLSSSPPTIKALQYATFELEFTITHPFAYETAIQKAAFLGTLLQNTKGNNKIVVIAAGTVKTPVQIIIRNITSQPITSITVTHKYVEI